jgi:hypothetical protein
VEEDVRIFWINIIVFFQGEWAKQTPYVVSEEAMMIFFTPSLQAASTTL